MMDFYFFFSYLDRHDGFLLFFSYLDRHAWWIFTFLWLFWKNFNLTLDVVILLKDQLSGDHFHFFKVELTPEQKALFPELTHLRQQIENLQVKYLLPVDLWFLWFLLFFVVVIIAQ